MTATLALPRRGARSGPSPVPRSRPRWERPALFALLAGTALLYLWDLGSSGYANSYYAAAVQAGTQSWKAFLFGSIDSANLITVDKPPAALWLMALSGRIFGFSSWSMLAPQALAGVVSVALLHAAVKRWAGPGAGLLAGAALALTPAAALMFRFNNPDALLVLLMVAGAYYVVRATEKASVGWLVLAGTAIGFGFLTKMLQAFLVLPAFALVYLVAAPAPLRRRLAHLLAATVAVVVSAGWWIALVELWPADSRPYIGGSENNGALELALGYNGLGRIFGGGGNGGGPGGGGGNIGFGGEAGLTRLFGQSFGGEVSWLLPAALIGLVAGLWFTRGAPRTDRTRAALLLWGGWLAVTGLVFSLMTGTIHPYYAVALAPAIAALAAIGSRELWRRRDGFTARVALVLMVAATAVWSFILLRNDTWQPELRYVFLVVGAVAAFGLLFGLDRIRKAGVVLVAASVLAGFGGTAAYAVTTAATPHTGSIPTSGPNSSAFGGIGRGGDGARENANSELAALLASTTTKWAAAASGAQGAASLELATGKAVMALGGFTGSDPAPTLEEFQQYVSAGEVTYYIAGGMGGGPGGSRSGNGIGTWVAANFTAVTVSGTTVYDLTQPIS